MLRPVCRGPSGSSGSASGSVSTVSPGPVKVRRNDRGPSGSVASGSAVIRRALSRSSGRIRQRPSGSRNRQGPSGSVGIVGVCRGSLRSSGSVAVRQGLSRSLESVGLRRDGWGLLGSSGLSRSYGVREGSVGIVGARRDRRGPSRTSGSVGHPDDEFGGSCSPPQCQCAGMQKSDKMPDREHRRRFYPAGVRY